MITGEAAGLALSIAKGLIKLTQRVDLVLAEKASVEGRLPTIQPLMILDPPPEVMVPALELLLEEKLEEPRDPLVADRAEIQTAVDEARAGRQAHGGQLGGLVCPQAIDRADLRRDLSRIGVFGALHGTATAARQDRGEPIG